jgi:hypothetical protein
VQREKRVRNPGKKDRELVKEEVARNGLEDTRNTRGIDAVVTGADSLKDALTLRYLDTITIR